MRSRLQWEQYQIFPWPRPAPVQLKFIDLRSSFAPSAFSGLVWLSNVAFAFRACLALSRNIFSRLVERSGGLTSGSGRFNHFRMAGAAREYRFAVSPVGFDASLQRI